MKVGDCYSRNVVTVRSDETPLDAAITMRKNKVGYVVIVQIKAEKLVPIGLLTDRDIAVKIVAEEVNPLAVTVEDLLCNPLVSASEQDDLDNCIKNMKRKALRYVPVIDKEGSLIGAFAVDDYLEIIAERSHILAG
jgi:CBS domain-containing protein